MEDKREDMQYDRLLCPMRIRSTKSKSSSLKDYRSEFEKDYHRIIGSASFRRLQDKTQVFPLDKSDFIRTRLTHSLEVSSIAKSIGQSVGHALEIKGIVGREQSEAICDILLCAGLLHDIGNPPFGHFGETVIREWFSRKLPELEFKSKSLSEIFSPRQIADLKNFEGNAQSLRVITRLHHLVDDNGMNLTKGLLNTIIKYPVSSDCIDKKAGDIRLKKMGYFEADEDIFHEIVQGTGAGNKRHPLVYLLEAADDIAYSTADLEDGVKKGILSYTHLLSLLENNRYKERYSKEYIYEDMEYAVTRLKKLYERGVANKEHDPESYAVQNWVVTMQSCQINSVCEAYIEHHDEIIRGEFRTDLFAGTRSEILSKVLKEIAFENIFQINDIIKLEMAADSILGGLLDRFVDAAIVYDTDIVPTARQAKLMQLISPNYLHVYNICAEGRSEEYKLYLRMLLVTDFIAGMTDHYAKSLYQEISGIY